MKRVAIVGVHSRDKAHIDLYKDFEDMLVEFMFAEMCRSVVEDCWRRLACERPTRTFLDDCARPEFYIHFVFHFGMLKHYRCVVQIQASFGGAAGCALGRTRAHPRMCSVASR